MRSCLEQRWPEAVVLFEPKAKGIDLLGRELPNIVILDTELPNGFSLLKQIRAFCNVPMIALIAQDKSQEKVRALEEGADDYLIKPPNGIELAAKVAALLRRTSPKFIDTSLTYSEDGFHINFAARELVSGEKAVKLTPTEYKLLYYLVKSKGKFISREALIRMVWGEEYLNIGGKENLRRYIYRLRSKLPKVGSQIVTHWGAGYRFISH